MTRDAMGIDRGRLHILRQREDKAFRARTPRSRSFYERGRRVMPHGTPQAWMAGFYPETPLYVTGGSGATFTDVDGNTYLDMSQCDLSMSCGYGPESVTSAVAAQFQAGSHFLLPTEDSITVCELLRERFGALFWQFTLSASSANTEAIRLSRLATGRDRTLIFSGKYHGHLDEALVHDTESGVAPDALGLSKSVLERTVVVPFNDLVALERALSTGEMACVLAEPVMTNLGVILPDDGYHEALRKLTKAYGTLLIIDETHTQIAEFGGFTRKWGLEPDIVTLGKSLGGGVPIGAYGVTEPLAKLIEAHLEATLGGPPGLAIGGTTYGNALGLAAARAALEHVLTRSGYERTAALGTKLADGIDHFITARRLPWRAYRLGYRSGICLVPSWPRNAIEACQSIDLEFSAATRVFLANRGVWEPLSIHGPTVSFSHTAEHVEQYLAVLEEFVDAVV